MRAYQITVLSPDCLSYFNIRYIIHKRWHYIFISYHIWAIQLKARRFNKYFWLIIYFKTFTMLGFTSYLHESFVFCNTILFGDTLRRLITIEIIFGLVWVKGIVLTILSIFWIVWRSQHSLRQTLNTYFYLYLFFPFKSMLWKTIDKFIIQNSFFYIILINMYK